MAPSKFPTLFRPDAAWFRRLTISDADRFVADSFNRNSAGQCTIPLAHSLRLQPIGPADVLAALKKRGQSLAGLSVAHAYHPTAAGKALKRPWPALEAIIAAALDLTPAQIWPTRYDADGQPISLRAPSR